MSVAGGRAAAGKLPTGVDAGGGPIPEPGKPALLWLLILGALSLGINGLLRYRRAER